MLHNIRQTYLYYFMLTTVPAALLLIWLSINYTWSIVTTISFIISYLAVYVFGINIYFHRYWSHRHFKSNPIVCRIFSIAGMLTMLGTPSFYALVHKYHHAYSDTDKDLHSPVHGRWHAIIGWMFNAHKLNLSPMMIKELFKDEYKWVFQLEKIKIAVVWIIPGIVTLISPHAGLGLLCAMFLSFFLDLWLNAFMHDPKTKQPLNAYKIFGWLTAGSLFHKMHHETPNRTEKADPAYYLVKMLNVKP